MKRLFLLILVLLFAIIGANAQRESKVKLTSSPTQKVHNVFSKHNQHNGYKVKTKTRHHKHKKVVRYKHGHTHVKTTGVIAWKELNVA